jgi:hypothetical protein
MTFQSFVRPFLEKSRNTALTIVVAANICVTEMIIATKVNRPIDQMGSRPEDRSATTHIHDWMRHFSFESIIACQNCLLRYKIV